MPGMAGGGLPDAEQKILADASVYLDELQKVKRENKTVEESNKALGESFGKLAEQITKIERQLRDLGRNREIVRNFVEMQKAIDAAYEANQRFNANPAEIEDHTHLIQEAAQAYREAAGAADFFRAAEERHVRQVIESSDSIEAHTAATNELIVARQRAAEVTRDLAAAHREVNSALTGSERIIRGEVSRGLRDIITSALPSGGTAAAAVPPRPAAPPPRETWPAEGGYGVYGAYRPGARAEEGGLAASTLRAMAADEAGRRISSIIPLLLGGGLLGAGGLITALGTGGTFGAFAELRRGLATAGRGIGAGLGAVGGGIGNVTDAIGGMMGAGPTAADTSRVVTSFIRRWYPAAHWAMMLSNELLATAGPALTAGTMGALTGVQGFEELIPRGRAIFRTSESLGDSLGKTTGQAWGLKTSYLQNAQDLATGLATQLAGAAVNIIRSPGTGGAFAQLGLNTDAMFARFAATLTQHFQKGGLGSQLSNMVTGGTGYLQQFGDVLANLGNTFLNMAPNLPGVGGDLLGLLSGGTHLLSSGTGWMGGMLGPLLAGEAGMRWGPAILGTAGRSISGIGNMLGNAGRGGWLSRIGLGTGMEGGLAGIGAAIGGLGAPEIGAIAAGAYYLNKAYTYQTPQAVAANQALTQISQMGFVPGYSAGIAQMQAWSQVKPGGSWMPGSGLGNIGGGLKAIYSGVNAWSPGQVWGGAVRAGHGILQLARSMGGGSPQFDPTAADVAQMSMDKLAGSMVSALASGGQIQHQWQQLSGSAISMGKATDIATMAQLQLGSAFQKNGQLSDQAKTMIANLYAGYAPMHMNAGMFGAATGAQTAMAGLQHTQIASVNQAFDQLTQLVTGGAATSAGLFGLLGGTPVSVRRGGLKLQPSPAMSKLAGVIAGGFTGPAQAAGWNLLTNQQSGLFPALEGQLNWLREAQTMGALGADQTTGMAGFEIAQLLPLVAKSPAGLAMLSTYAQQFGMPGFKPGQSARSMRSAMARWLSQVGVGKGGFNRLMTLGTEGMANIGTDANQFVQNLGSGIGDPMAAAIFTHGEDLMKTFMGVAGHRGSAGALSNLANFMFGSGTPLAGAQAMVKVAATRAGATPQSIQSMMGQLKHQYDIYIKIHADTGALNQIKSQISGVKFAVPPVKVHVRADGVATATQQIQGIKGKNVTVFAAAKGTGAAQAAINSVHGKVVDIVVRTIMTGGSVSQAAMQAAGYAPGVSASQIASVVRKSTPPGGQRGMKIPGYGGGDIFPAMLEPGELVVPKHMVAAGLVDHMRGTIPGFAGGGVVGESTYGPGAYWGMGSKMALWNPALYMQLRAAMNATQPHVPPYISGPVHADAIHAAIVSAGASAGSSSQGAGPTLAKLNAEIRKAWQTLDKLYAQKDSGTLHGAALARLNAQIKNFWKTVLDPLYAQKDALTGGRGHSVVSSQSAQLAKIAREFTIHLSGDIAKEVKNSSAAKNIATALINKLTQEVGYAKSVQSAMKQGLNLGGMDVTPGTGGGTVLEQMQSYAGSLKSFSGDLSKLGKGHLNKELMKQIVAAGPVQGDALAQSILNDYGGIGAVNKQYAQITKMANKLGISAAELQYGGHLSDNLRSGTVSSHGISINVNLNKGAGGTLDLTPEQIAAIVAKVQAALLKQAKKNNKTGIKLHGKGS